MKVKNANNSKGNAHFTEAITPPKTCHPRGIGYPLIKFWTHNHYKCDGMVVICRLRQLIEDRRSSGLSPKHSLENHPVRIESPKWFWWYHKNNATNDYKATFDSRARMTLNLSVIICTKDRPDDLQECIASILRGKRLPEELIVVDDGNLDPKLVQGMLKNFNINFQYRKKSPPNVNVSRNLAATLATGDILSFLDDDVILDPNYYSSVMRAFEEDYKQRIAGITGAIKIYTHPLKRAFLRFFGLESNQPGKVQSCGAVTLVRAGEIHQPIEVEWLSGCNMNFRKSILEKYHFADQDSGYIWGDDRDFTYPIGQKHTLVALPDATLIHKKSPISRPAAKNLGRMEIFHLGRFFVNHLPPSLKNWFALAWAFVGIFIKNLLGVLMPRKGSTSFQQFLGNIDGLFQFIAYLRSRK